MQIRQIDIKNQYGLKRKESWHYQNEAGSSLHSGKPTQTYNNITEPLQGAIKTQTSFKGSYLSTIQNALKPSLKPIPKKLVNKVFESLEKISKKQNEDYKDIIQTFVSRAQTNDKFRKKLGLSKEIAESMSADKLDNLYYIPEKKLFKKFLDQIIEPFTIAYEWAEKLVLPKEKLQEKLTDKKVLKDFSSLQGLIKSHEIWENGYRGMSGNKKWTENSKFLIPDDVLFAKINRRRKKIVDPDKGKYSTTSLMLGNRFISGVVYSYFLGTDAYNTTMRYSNDKHEANSQRKSRVAQEFSRIGLNMYIQNLLFGTFSNAVNKSLSTALFVSGSTAACSEVLGRKLVGKPIMPSDKETLDRLEKEMSEKKGVLPAVGRLLTNVKKKGPVLKSSSNVVKKENSVAYEKIEPNKKLYSAFAKDSAEQAHEKSHQTNEAVSFKGLNKGSAENVVKNLQKPSKLKKFFDEFFEKEQFIDKNRLEKILAALKEADIKEYENIRPIVEKAVSKSKFAKQNGAVLSKMKGDSSRILDIENIDEIPLGMKKTPWGQVTKSLLVPVNFVKNTIKSIGKSISKLYRKLTGKSNDISAQALEKLINSKDPKDIVKIQKFNEFYLQRLNLDAWKQSSLSDNVKKIRIFDEFNQISRKDKEDIEGAKNILLWLEKQIKREKITINENNTLSEVDAKKLQNIMKDAVLKADGSTHVEYDGNTLAQTNINLSRAITTLFLVTDAYNLTMQYSGDNKKDASKSAKNRAAQEVSRIGVSAYLMAFVHNLLSKLCNSSLGGAFTLTALTSSINDSLSRKVVGVPLTSKSQAELAEIDSANLKSSNPVKKALAYSIGKKGLGPQGTKAEKNALPDFFNSDFFIAPKIN